MITEHGTRRLQAPLLRVLKVLLEPQQLPRWNPAFLSLGGPREPHSGVRYPIMVHGGMHGFFEYLDIGARYVSTTWQVPGFRETGTWCLEPRGAATVVRHEYEHHGDQAGPLRALAGLGLHRLADRVAASEVASWPGGAGELGIAKALRPNAYGPRCVGRWAKTIPIG